MKCVWSGWDGENMEGTGQTANSNAELSFYKIACNSFFDKFHCILDELQIQVALPALCQLRA